MKRKLGKSLVFILTVCTLSLMTLICAGAATVKNNGLVYNTSGSSATLVSCSTNSATVKIPSKVGKYKVTVIGEKAFLGKNKIKSVTIPSTVTTIKKSAFYKCTSLSSITIPSSVKKIEASAFGYCTALKGFTLPKTVTSLGTNVFKECNNVTVYVYAGSKGESYLKSYSNINMVYRYMTSLKLGSSSLSLVPGNTSTLSVTTYPSKLYNSKVTFTSSNTKIATVSDNGVVTAKDCGTVMITCAAKDGSGKKANCIVRVYPAKVTGVKSSAVTTTGYTLSWTASKGSDGYIVSRYDSSSKEWSNIAYTSSNSYKLTALPLGSSFTYRVTAYANSGNKKLYSSPSSNISVSVAKPSKVTSLKAVAAGENKVSLSWSPASNATGYKIYLYDKATGKYTYKGASEGISTAIGGLCANTEYAFAVRSYVRTQKSSLDCSEYSETVTVTTLPSKVTGVAAEKQLIYRDRLTLSWNEVEGATGYKVYMYNKESKNYKLYTTVQNPSAEINGLITDTAYNFRVKAYKQSGTSTVEGALSNVYTVKTAFVPHTPEQSAQCFVDAYANLKTSSGKQTVIMNLSVKDMDAPDSDRYENVLNSITKRNNGYYTFTDGIEDTKGLSISELVYPCSEENRLSLRDIILSTVDFKEDGFGYSISFDVNSKKIFEIASKPDFTKVAKENESFILNSFEAENGNVEAKIIDGKISSLKIKVPVTAVFSFEGERYEISYTLSQNYSF